MPACQVDSRVQCPTAVYVCLSWLRVLYIWNRCICIDTSSIRARVCDFCKMFCIVAIIKLTLLFCLQCNGLRRTFLFSLVYERILHIPVSLFSPWHKHSCVLHWNCCSVFCLIYFYIVIWMYSIQALSVSRHLDNSRSANFLIKTEFIVRNIIVTVFF